MHVLSTRFEILLHLFQRYDQVPQIKMGYPDHAHFRDDLSFIDYDLL